MTIATTMGVVEVDVDAAEAPIAAANFVALAGCGFYDGLVFHRIVPGFIIQGGDPTGTGKGGAGYAITDEPQRGVYERGVVALSRTAAANSQSSQFFIVLSDEAGRALSVTNNYAIVGRVISGMDVVDEIAAGPNGGPPLNKAGDPVVMLTVTVDPMARLSLGP
ncbi:MAG TPA: peptidylprolyl isomerase [Candidatus Polarisedimenticolia bacterium]|nr:peptidylprolyl isomerase [Candidatus Polarisedimenticolia bacterium]